MPDINWDLQIQIYLQYMEISSSVGKFMVEKDPTKIS